MIDFNKRIDGYITVMLFDNDAENPTYIICDEEFNKTIHYKSQQNSYRYISEQTFRNTITRLFPDMEFNKRTNMHAAIWSWGGVNINPTNGNWKGFM